MRVDMEHLGWATAPATATRGCGATRAAMGRGLTLLISALSALVPSAQILAILWLIWRRTPHVLWWDEWDEVAFVHKFEAGQLRIGDLFAFHNEHRIVIPRLIDLPIVVVAGWNRQIEMTVDLLFAIAGAGLLVLCVRRTFGCRDAARALAVPVSLLALSLGAYEDWAWAFQVTFITTVFGVIFCAWALGTQPLGPRRFALAILGAVIASLSSFAGLAVWVALFPILWAADYHRRRVAAIWVACALGIIIPYFHSFPTGPPASISPAQTIRFALAYLGAPFGASPGLASPVLASQLCAALGIVAFSANVLVFWRWTRDIRPIVPWIGLALFGLACTAITALGRGPTLGVAQALASRYEIFSSLWWIALVVVVARMAATILAPRGAGRAARRLRGLAIFDLLLVAAVCAGMARANVRGLEAGRDWMAPQRQHEECIRYYAQASDPCLGLFFLPERIRADANDLVHDHLSIFRDGRPLDQLPTNPAPTLAYIDSVGPVTLTQSNHGPVIVPQGATFTVQGWAVDADARVPARAVFVVVDGRPLLADYGAERPDAAAAYRIPAYRESGFAARVDAAGLAPGVHSLTLWVVANNYRSYFKPPVWVTFAIVAPGG